MLRRGPKNNANPNWGSENIFITWKFCVFVGTVEILLYSQNHFGAMLIGFGETELVETILSKNYLKS